MSKSLNEDSLPPDLSVTGILGSNNWYESSQPTWNRAPSSETAATTRRAYVKRLRRFRSEFSSAAFLAAVLEDCGSHNRCISGACPECARAFQRWFVQVGARLSQTTHPADSPSTLLTVSVVFPDERVPADKIDTLDPVEAMRELNGSISRANVVDWMLAGIDVSLNDDSQKKLGTAWQLQMYGVAMVRDVKEFSNSLRAAFPASKHVRRPVQVKVCDGSHEAISYGFKTGFVRRIAYKGTSTGSGVERKCWRTRKLSLRPVEQVQLSMWLHRVGLDGRLFMHNLKMKDGRNDIMQENTKTE